MAYYDDFTTVATLGNGEVVLVGEEHGNRTCGELATDVLEDVEPVAVAVEHARLWYSATLGAAMGRMAAYARRHGVPLIAIDETSQIWRSTLGPNDRQAQFLAIANSFTHPITERGDVNERAIDNARQAIYELYGPDTYDALYELREQAMAERLKRAVHDYGEPIVAAIGTFHIKALQRYYESAELSMRGLPSNRVETEDSNARVRS